jgi:hypothetical protein
MEQSWTFDWRESNVVPASHPLKLILVEKIQRTVTELA